MKYMKKPVYVDAICWTGINLEEIKEFCGDHIEYKVNDSIQEKRQGFTRTEVKVLCNGTKVSIKVGDYIVKTSQGIYLVYNHRHFTDWYEPIEDKED